MLSMTVSLWSRFVVLLTSAAFGSCLVLAFMEDGPYANTRHHAIRRLAAQAQQAANSVVTPAALGGQPSRRPGVLCGALGMEVVMEVWRALSPASARPGGGREGIRRAPLRTY